MARISDAQIAAVVIAAGFPKKDQAKAVAIALAESSGDPLAKNTANRNGTTDYGLFQINSVHTALLRSGSWSNPADNARMAYAVYKEAGNRFTPWVAYTSGSYLAYVGRGRTAIGAPSFSGPLKGWGAATDAPSVFASMFTDRDTWIRAAMFLAGGLLVIWGLLSLTTVDNKLGKLAFQAAVTKGAGKAAKAV